MSEQLTELTIQPMVHFHNKHYLGMYKDLFLFYTLFFNATRDCDEQLTRNSIRIKSEHLNLWFAVSLVINLSFITEYKTPNTIIFQSTPTLGCAYNLGTGKPTVSVRRHFQGHI